MSAGLAHLLAGARVWLCDLDGTLVNSCPAHEAAFRTAITEIAPELLGSFRYGAHAGASTAEVMRALGAGPDLVDRLVRRKQRLYRDYVAAGQVKVFAGAYELLDRLSARGHEVHLVTSGSRGSVERVLAACSLGRYFRGVLTGDDVPASKPDPEFYRAACRRWSVDPASAVAVEDSAHGVASAVAAGLRTLHVHVPQAAPGALAVPDLRALAGLVAPPGPAAPAGPAGPAVPAVAGDAR